MTSDQKLRLECLKICYTHGRGLPETLQVASTLRNYVLKGTPKAASATKPKQNWLLWVKRLTTPKVNEEPTGQSESRQPALALGMKQAPDVSWISPSTKPF